MVILSESWHESVGDVVDIVTASSTLYPLGLMPKGMRFQVTGIFNTGLYEFDNSTALVAIGVAQKLFGLEGRASYIQVKLANIVDAPAIGERIKAVLPPIVYITTWMELNKSLFSALKLEKNIMFLTITLIVFVAALNIIASLILMVMEKTRDIGILMAIGAPASSIQKIFFLQGAMIGVLGTSAGVVLGLISSWLANAFRKLWARIRNDQLGVTFRRQHAIGNYIVDFCSPRQKIIIELDGSQHLDQKEYDAERAAFLESGGYRILRFWNNAIMNDTDGVLREIELALEGEADQAR